MLFDPSMRLQSTPNKVMHSSVVRWRWSSLMRFIAGFLNFNGCLELKQLFFHIIAIHSQGGGTAPRFSSFLAYLVILCFERQCAKQNTVAPHKIFGLYKMVGRQRFCYYRRVNYNIESCGLHFLLQPWTASGWCAFSARLLISCTLFTQCALTCHIVCTDVLCNVHRHVM